MKLETEELLRNNQQTQPNKTICDVIYIVSPFLATTLGGSIGLGETKKHLGTSLKEFCVSAAILLATALILSWVLKRQGEWDTHKKAFLRASALTLGFFIGAYAIAQSLNSAGIVQSYLDQSHSRIAAEKLRHAFGIKNPLAFQTYSYEFGYMLLAVACVMALAMLYYRYRHITNSTQKDTNAIHKKKTKAVLFGFTFGVLLIAVNVGVHSIAATLAHSTRPIVGTRWANMPLNPSWWAKLDGLGQISNAGAAPHSNWYSGHVSFIGTAFWMAFFCMCLYTKYYVSPSNNNNNQNSNDQNNGTSEGQGIKNSKLLFFGWLGVLILFSMTAITAICRVGGTAHTINAVISGFVLSMFTTLLSMGLFSIMRDHPRRMTLIILGIGVAFGGYKVIHGLASSHKHLSLLGLTSLSISVLALMVCGLIYCIKPKKTFCGIQTQALWDKKTYLFKADDPNIQLLLEDSNNTGANVSNDTNNREDEININEKLLTPGTSSHK